MRNARTPHTPSSGPRRAGLRRPQSWRVLDRVRTSPKCVTLLLHALLVSRNDLHSQRGQTRNREGRTGRDLAGGDWDMHSCQPVHQGAGKRSWSARDGAQSAPVVVAGQRISSVAHHEVPTKRASPSDGSHQEGPVSSCQGSVTARMCTLGHAVGGDMRSGEAPKAWCIRCWVCSRTSRPTEVSWSGSVRPLRGDIPSAFRC
jgi:hypothetical protein